MIFVINSKMAKKSFQSSLSSEASISKATELKGENLNFSFIRLASANALWFSTIISENLFYF